MAFSVDRSSFHAEWQNGQFFPAHVSQFWQGKMSIGCSIQKTDPLQRKTSQWLRESLQGPKRVCRGIDADLEKGMALLCLLLFKWCALDCDFVVCLQKGFHVLLCCLHPCPVPTTAHHWTKGSKAMVTCLSPLSMLYRRGNTQSFFQATDPWFSSKCGMLWVGLGNHSLRGGGSILRNGVKFSPINMVYLKFFFKTSGEAKWHFRVPCCS